MVSIHLTAPQEYLYQAFGFQVLDDNLFHNIGVEPGKHIDKTYIYIYTYSRNSICKMQHNSVQKRKVYVCKYSVKLQSIY